jgi:4-carboxymuconolactone decarboxylase
MPDAPQTPAQRLIGDFAPKMVSLTDEVLFGDIWSREELPRRDRSLITVAALSPTGTPSSCVLTWRWRVRTASRRPN